jgi:ArsR family transcriptional regulator
LEISDALSALSDKTRLSILRHLLARDYCAGALAQVVGVADAAAARHIRILRAAGLVRGEKRGAYVHYAADRAALRALAEESAVFADLMRESPPSPPAACQGAGGCPRRAAALGRRRRGARNGE